MSVQDLNTPASQAALLGAIAPKPDAVRVAALYDHITNPRSAAMDGNTLYQLTLTDWEQAFAKFRNELSSRIGTGINTDLNLQLQQKQRADQEKVSQDFIKASAQREYDLAVMQKRDTIKAIKAKKFPKSDIASLGIASSTPLKHISVATIDNQYQAGNIDLASALVERFALNRGEYDGRTREELQNYALKYYEAIGVASLRSQLRYLNVLITALNYQVQIAGTPGLRISLATSLQMSLLIQDFYRNVGDDSLLELS